MKQIMPNKEFNLDDEVERLREHSIRRNRMEIAINILIILILSSLLITIWATHNQRMSNQAWQEGYDRGYEQAQWDFIDREINSRDYGTTYMEPSSDAEIWERYHDCNMYGLPEYARPICESKVQES